MKRPTYAAGIFALVVLLLLGATGCSLLDRALEHGQQLLDTHAQKKQAGWQWEGFFTCDDVSKLEIDGNGDRWCARRLAPTIADCQNNGGLVFWFGDSLSGMSRQVLYGLCQDSRIGEHWQHLDGVFEGGRLVVRDANRGSEPL